MPIKYGKEKTGGTSGIPTEIGNKLGGAYIMAQKKRQGSAGTGRQSIGTGRLWQALRDTAGYRQDYGGNRACENGRVDRKTQGNLRALGDSAQAYKYGALQSC